MSHAQTRQMTADGCMLTIGWQMDWMHKANAATVPGRRRRDLSAGPIERKSQMKRYYRDHSDMHPLPSGEIKETAFLTDDQILKNNKAV